MQEDFWMFFKYLRILCGWTQKDVAKNLGVSSKTIYRIENDLSGRDLVNYYALLKLFEIQADNEKGCDLLQEVGFNFLLNPEISSPIKISFCKWLDSEIQNWKLSHSLDTFILIRHLVIEHKLSEYLKIIGIKQPKIIKKREGKMKIVINGQFGGYSLSQKVFNMLNERGYKYSHIFDLESDYRMRTNSDLINIIEKLGDEANGECAELKIIEIPDNATDWKIMDYDGAEEVIYVINGIIHCES